MLSRVIYLLAGISALYMALVPMLSDIPNLRPAWFTVSIWLGAIFLILASLHRIQSRASRLAVIGSCFIVALYGCQAIMPLLIRLGYYRVEDRLVASHQSAFDRWRFILDRPVFYILFLSAFASLFISVR